MRYLLQLGLRLPGVAGFLGRTGGMTGVGGDGGSLRGGGTSGLAGEGVLSGILIGCLIGSLNGLSCRSGISCGTRRGGIIDGIISRFELRAIVHKLTDHKYTRSEDDSYIYRRVGWLGRPPVECFGPAQFML